MGVRRGGGRGMRGMTTPKRAHVRSNRAGVSRAPDSTTTQSAACAAILAARSLWSSIDTHTHPPPRGTLQIWTVSGQPWATAAAPARSINV